MPPRIGITCDFETVIDKRGAPAPRYLLQTSYVTAVREAGGQPWLLPHLEPKDAPSVLDQLDGIVISGGDFDIPPAYYNETPRPKLGHLNEQRSAFERALLEEARQRSMPLLGICGGMQLLNVVHGGSLFQDNSERPGTSDHQQRHDKRQPSHGVELIRGSRLHSLLGATHVAVNSTHHQVIHALGVNLRATALAEDGVVEGIEGTGSAFVVGVQWHPEALGSAEQLGIYRGLVAATKG